MARSSTPTARKQLLRLQRETFERLEDEVIAKREHESDVFRAYRKRYERETRAFEKVSSKSELLERVLESSIVYCGDYHTLSQAQRTVIRVLRDVIPKRTVYLALEVVPRSGEKLANDYVRKRIDETRFLDGIHYQQRWGFPWSHYRQLFMFAREHSLRILALNSDRGDRLSLESRDQLAAQIITQHTLSAPDALIFCLYGDLHLAKAHIPKQVEERLKKANVKRKMLTIFQNSPTIYWDLAERSLEDRVDVVEISSRSFCVLSAAPWIKYQSYLSWLEDQTYLVDEVPQSPEETDLLPDYYHEILGQAQRVGRFLELFPKGLEQFTVLTPQDTRIIKELNKYCKVCEGSVSSISPIIHSEIVENGSCYFPERSVLYLSDSSENRVAEKAAQLLVAKLASNFSLFGRNSTRREVFYRLVLWEAIAYFGSKIINPKRKCDHYRDLERRIRLSRNQRARGRSKEQKEVAQQVLMHRLYERRKIHKLPKPGEPKKIYQLPPRTFFLCASTLGKILADRLFYMMMNDQIRKTTLRELFRPFEKGETFAFDRYWELARIRPLRPRRASKEDRF